MEIEPRGISGRSVPVCYTTVWAVAFTIFLTLPLLAPAPAHPGIWYVAPRTEIALRGGQGTEYRVVAAVRVGSRVELLEESGDWARIRLANGTEGWTLKRYLSQGPPLEEGVSSLMDEKTRLMAELRESTQKGEACAADLKQCQGALERCSKERGALGVSFEELRRDASGVLGIKADYEQARTDLEKLRERVALLEQGNRGLKNDSRIWWFMAGGGVLVAGWLIGVAMGRVRRRRLSL